MDRQHGGTVPADTGEGQRLIMLEVKQTAQFKRDLKLCAKRRYDLQRLTAVVDVSASAIL